MNLRPLAVLAVLGVGGCDHVVQPAAPKRAHPPQLALSPSLSSVVVTDLGTLPGGGSSESNGINARGQVVGFGDRRGAALFAALWTVGPGSVMVQDLGTLPGFETDREANAINARGQVVGGIGQLSGTVCCRLAVGHAALWSVGPRGVTVRDLGTLPGEPFSEAFGINARGEVVGESGPLLFGSGRNQGHAAFWTVGPGGVTVRDLGTFPGGFPASKAFGINDRRQVVGWAFTADRLGRALRQHAALWTVGHGGVTVQDLGALPGGGFSQAQGINNRGQVVGIGLSASGFEHAVLWTVSRGSVTVQDLGTLPGGTFSEAFGINGRGQIVGESSTAAISPDPGIVLPPPPPPGPPPLLEHAALWTVGPGGVTVQDLGTLPGGERSIALGINNRGQVVGWSQDKLTSAAHAVLWTVGPLGDQDVDEDEDAGELVEQEQDRTGRNPGASAAEHRRPPLP